MVGRLRVAVLPQSEISPNKNHHNPVAGQDCRRVAACHTPCGLSSRYFTRAGTRASLLARALFPATITRPAERWKWRVPAFGTLPSQHTDSLLTYRYRIC
jgi:hypothetical protein